MDSWQRLTSTDGRATTADISIPPVQGAFGGEVAHRPASLDMLGLREQGRELLAIALPYGVEKHQIFRVSIIGIRPFPRHKPAAGKAQGHLGIDALPMIETVLLVFGSCEHQFCQVDISRIEVDASLPAPCPCKRTCSMALVWRLISAKHRQRSALQSSKIAL